MAEFSWMDLRILKMLQNEYLLANAGADTAKNEPTLHKFGQICEFK